MSKKQDKRAQLVVAYPDTITVIVDGVRYSCLNEAADSLGYEREHFKRRVLQRKVVVVVPGK